MRLRGFILCALILCVGQSASAAPVDLAVDTVFPGAGAFSNRHFIAGGLIAAGRIGTGLLAYRFRQQEIEYRSAQNSARIAELVFGPGYRYQNPYGGGAYTAAEYGRIADRRGFYSRLSIIGHIAILGTSLILTDSYATPAPPVFTQDGTPKQEQATIYFRFFL